MSITNIFNDLNILAELMEYYFVFHSETDEHKIITVRSESGDIYFRDSTDMEYSVEVLLQGDRIFALRLLDHTNLTAYMELKFDYYTCKFKRLLVVGNTSQEKDDFLHSRRAFIRSQPGVERSYVC